MKAFMISTVAVLGLGLFAADAKADHFYGGRGGYGGYGRGYDDDCHHHHGYRGRPYGAGYGYGYGYQPAYIAPVQPVYVAPSYPVYQAYPQQGVSFYGKGFGFSFVR